MTSPSKPAFTAGPWTAVNNPASNYGLEIVADVKVKARRVVCRVSGPDREANAALIAEAGTVAHETGMTPRQLAERCKELEGALTRAVQAHGPFGDDTRPEWWIEANAILAKATGGASHD